MILFFENGRLGNQLFQYFGLKYYFPRHKLLAFGCEDLSGCFDSVDAQFMFKDSKKHQSIIRILRAIVFFFVVIRLFGRITEANDKKFFKLVIRQGLFYNIYVPQDIYFQHRDIIALIKDAPCLRSDVNQAARNWLNENIKNLDSCSLIFVHIRRGDYLRWPTSNFPAVLGLSWYKLAIKFIEQRIDNPVFILMSDDQYYLQDTFENSEQFVISNNSKEIDMALMSFCTSGILSASSFAWWGAFYARANQKQEGIFVAPQFWGGYRLKKWHPKNFITDWLIYQ